MTANFLDIHAAADYIGPGAIEVPLYQTEILDIVRRRNLFGQRIRQVPATGHPSRYFEQTAIPNPSTAGFVDPRNIVPPVVTPTRVERSVPLKAIVAQLNYNLFDMELGAQQKQFAYLQAKDLVDTIEGVMLTHDVAAAARNHDSFGEPELARCHLGHRQRDSDRRRNRTANGRRLRSAATRLVVHPRAGAGSGSALTGVKLHHSASGSDGAVLHPHVRRIDSAQLFAVLERRVRQFTSVVTSRRNAERRGPHAAPPARQERDDRITGRNHDRI
jgi:hypothetical protein